MAHELLLAGTVTDKDFMTLVRTYTVSPDSPTLMLLETQPHSVVKQEQRQGLLHFAHFQHDFDFTLYTSGRIFHKFGEVHWERLYPLVQVVYTGSTEYQPTIQATNGLNKESLSACPTRDRKYLLFGKRLDEGQLQRIGSPTQTGDFAEVRIPRLLRYPPLDDTAKAERVQIEIREYLHSATGTNVAYRFYNLVPFETETSQERKNA